MVNGSSNIAKQEAGCYSLEIRIIGLVQTRDPEIEFLFLLIYRKICNLIGGSGEIRTHGAFRHDSFQDCCHKPDSATLPIMILKIYQTNVV